MKMNRCLFSLVVLNFVCLISSASVTISSEILDNDKSIYGVDDRIDIFESRDFRLNQMSLSVASMFNKEAAYVQNLPTVKVAHGQSLAELGFCPSEKFSRQKTISDCTGFLIAPNKIMTAGHCIRTEADCQRNEWVFDFANHSQLDTYRQDYFISKKNIYQCKKIIESVLDETGKTNQDFAVIELDRPVTDRSPLPLRKSGVVEIGVNLAVIGNPMGMPLKIAGGAWVVENKDEYFFRTNSDTYGGNSGSPVINLKTYKVEGILVRGRTDFEANNSKGCAQSIVYAQGGNGESVTRVTKTNGQNL